MTATTVISPIVFETGSDTLKKHGRRNRGRSAASGSSRRAAGELGGPGGSDAPVAGGLAGDRRPGSAHEPPPAGQAGRGQDYPGLRGGPASAARGLHHAGYRRYAAGGPAG